MKNQTLRFLLLIVCLSTMSVASADNYRCTATKLNIRKNADKSGKVIGQIAQNETVDILSINGEWGILLYQDDTGYIKMQYLEASPNQTQTVQSAEKSWTDKQKAIFWICLIMAIGIYAFAIVQVRRGKLIVIKGWIDLGLLIFPCLVMYSTIFGAQFFYEILGVYIFTALIVIAGLCLIGSLLLSIIANWGNLFNIFFSLVMKLVVIPIISLGVFYLIFKILDKNGINGKSILIFAILGILIGGLMSFED